MLSFKPSSLWILSLQLLSTVTQMVQSNAIGRGNNGPSQKKSKGTVIANLKRMPISNKKLKRRTREVLPSFILDGQWPSSLAMLIESLKKSPVYGPSLLRNGVPLIHTHHWTPISALDVCLASLTYHLNS